MQVAGSLQAASLIEQRDRQKVPKKAIAEVQMCRELATSAEKAAGHSYMNPQGTWGRRGRPAYGASALPSDFTGVAATTTAELPSIFPKRDEAAGSANLLEKSVYPQTLRYGSVSAQTQLSGEGRARGERGWPLHGLAGSMVLYPSLL